MKLKTIASVAAGTFGLLASTVGLIAVFFPSMLNLEKKAPEQLQTLIAKESDVLELETFLRKNVGRYVYLDLGICINYPENACPKIRQDAYGIDVQGCGNSTKYDSLSINPHSDTSDPIFLQTGDLRDQCVWKEFDHASDGELVAAGYFYVPNNFENFPEGFQHWHINRSTEEIALGK
ncbi:hypothetical protein E8K88_02635 [Lampropedia aestuarii]|uniref:Uncharacterized protein n=1 Tax=Lampropedia aestuarii TaxID=2562762 RepID=A0A4S5BUK7_9BURK|nr:hypothetical protein [Lampropedia aestuarii]THJ36179.1 hypothetical protein E8K88_02635 [Lampropedia aestuarii]